MTAALCELQATGTQFPILPGTSPGDLYRCLDSLYREQRRWDPNDYLASHAERKPLDHHLRTFTWYSRYLPANGTILDWGCCHGPDSCMIRAVYGDRFQLHGCDFYDADRFSIFRDFSGIEYRRLDDVVVLPYESQTFDVVVASGVLEHAAMDYESLKEVYRVTRRDGLLILTYLPNWLSIDEWFRRHVSQRGCHRRLYGLTKISGLLKQTGFYPEVDAYQSFFWQKRFEKLGNLRVQRLLMQRLVPWLPKNFLCSTLLVVARKVFSM